MACSLGILPWCEGVAKRQRHRMISRASGAIRCRSAGIGSIFDQRLVDLGDCEDEAFDGALTPEGEIWHHRRGVNATFLENAEAYYKKYARNLRRHESHGLSFVGLGYFRPLRQRVVSPEMLLDLALEGGILFRKMRRRYQRCR